MKIAYASDIHIEFGMDSFEYPDADILILAGDILQIKDLFKDNYVGENSRNFLYTVSQKYKNVIWVPGNHEYFFSDIAYADDLVKKYLFENFLDNIDYGTEVSKMIDGVLFLGTTLWTDFNKDNPLTHGIVANYMQDYNVIGCQGRKLNTQDIYIRHDKSRIFLEDSIDGANIDQKIVVATHHAPTFLSSDPRYRFEESSFGFYCTDMEDLILDNTDKIKYWISGHSHIKTTFDIANTKFLVNTRGYKNIEDTSKFDFEIVEI